jgi:hypothetical protein
MVTTLYPEEWIHPATELLTMFDLPSFHRTVPSIGSYSKIAFNSSCNKAIIGSIIYVVDGSLPHVEKW